MTRPKHYIKGRYDMKLTYHGLKASIVSQRNVMMIHGNSMSKFNQGYIQALDEIAQRCEYYEKKIRKNP